MQDGYNYKPVTPGVSVVVGFTEVTEVTTLLAVDSTWLVGSGGTVAVGHGAGITSEHVTSL